MRCALPVAMAVTCAAVPLAQQDLAQTPTIVTTQHQVTVGGAVRRYTARAGTIPIRDNETGDVHANMFFVAYTLDQPPGAPAAPARPLTFLWNGGPGSNSGLVHLLGFGPRRITAATGAMPRYSPAGTALVDNQETWLTFSDLVFVDPIGTGYSRPVKTEYGPEFYQSPGDAESVSEFIRVYRLRSWAAEADGRRRLGPSESPIYLMGESYGVTRASLVAEVLTRKRAKVAGVILLSGGFPMEGDVPAPMRNALSLPIWTAAAYHHKKLAPDLQQGSIDLALGVARAYAEGDYANALARVDALTPVERDAVVGRLARFTGLPSSHINTKTLRVTTEQMSTTLLDQDRMIGRYDSRAVGPRDKSGGPYDPTTDPSLKDILDATSVLRYLREELGYKSDLQYQGPFGGGYPPPTAFRGDWMSVRWNRNIASPPGLSAALAADPDLRVFHACGYFDLLGGCYASDYAARHVAPALAPRIMSRVYAGGHATYEDDGPRRQLRTDVAQFIQGGGRK